MNQEEKTRKTREKIMSAAMHEFASNGYAGASINTICQSGGISKGNLYHQFPSKEELYIACVREAFRSLTDFLKMNLPNQEITPELYFQVRSDYFRDHPLEGGVFCNAVLFPPLDLKARIEECRAGFDELNRSILRQILAHRKIRDDLTEDQILAALRYFQDALNAGFRNLMPADEKQANEIPGSDRSDTPAAGNTAGQTEISRQILTAAQPLTAESSPSYAAAVTAHEKACRTALSIFLYGIFS